MKLEALQQLIPTDSEGLHISRWDALAPVLSRLRPEAKLTGRRLELLRHGGCHNSRAPKAVERKPLTLLIGPQIPLQVARPPLSSRRARGDTINLIYSNKSWLAAKRHLGRLEYDRLIEFNPKNSSFLVEEGIQKGEEYTPQPGDFLFSIDAEIKSSQQSIKPENLELLHQNINGTGEIYRIKQSPKSTRYQRSS